MRFYPLNLGPYPSPPAPPSRASTLREPPTAAARLSPGVAACAPPLSRCSCWVPCVSPRSAWLARLFPERSILGPPSQAPCKVRTLALSLPKRSSTLLPSVSIRLPNPQTRAAGSGASAPLSPRAPPSPTLALASRASLPLARAPLQVQNRTPPHPPPGWLSFFLAMARWYPAPLGPESSAPAPCSAGSTSADSRVVGAAVSHIAALLIAEAARGPAGGAGQVTTRATAAQHCAALPGPERARLALCPGHRGHRGQSERQGQDRRPATWGGSRGPAGSRRRAGTDPKQPSWRGGGCWPDRSPTCHGAIFIIHPYSSNPGFPGGSVVKDRPAIQETRVPSLGRENPLEKAMATHSSILGVGRILGKSHGQRSLEGCSPWSPKELETT